MSALRGAAQRSRPIRIAFLVGDNPNAHLALDGLIADCYRRWGGRFSLIVPCDDDKIRASYWPWLESFDPDIVYSYVELASPEILEIHERLGPSTYEQHKHHGEPRLDVFGFKPDYGTSPLSSLSTIFRLFRYRGFGEKLEPLKIVDSAHSEDRSRFLSDSFGTYGVSYSTGIFPADARTVASLVTIAKPRDPGDRRIGFPRGEETFPDEAEAFKAIAEQRATALAITSLVLASKREIDRWRWSGSFNLVVGDEIDDRILFWNARLLIPAWLDRDLCCLRISPAQLDDPVFFETLITFLNNHNHVNRGSGGQSQLTVRSTSVPLTELEKIVLRLREGRCWSMADAHFVGSLDELVPAQKELDGARPGGGFAISMRLGPSWSNFDFDPPNARPPVDAPEHLADAPARHQFTGGHWATEYAIEQGGAKPRFSNDNLWLLPRRWRTALAFKTNFSRVAQGLIFPQRSSGDGFFVQFQSLERRVTDFFVPDAENAVHYAFCRDGDWARGAGEDAPIIPRPRARIMEPSNEARYLSGVIGMAGSIGAAQHYLLHPFLTDMFAQFGGTPALSSNKIEPTLNRIQRLAAREAPFDLSKDTERQAFATLVLKAAQGLKSPAQYLRYDELVRNWNAYRTDVREKQDPGRQVDPEWEAYEKGSLETCLVEMRSRSMIFQGHQWTCEQCHHRNWVDLTGLAPRLICGVCQESFAAPIALEWLFRPNMFLIEALRDHSVLSLLWVLSALKDRARNSIGYVGPSKFWFERDGGPPEAEADLLMIVDGQTIVCEAKSSWASLRAQHVQDLVDLALKLRPDVALLAIMDTGERQGDAIAKGRAALANSGIEFRLLTLREHPLEDKSYLT